MSTWPYISSDQKMSIWPETSTCKGYIWPNVSLTWSLNLCDPNDINLTWPEVSTCRGYIWPNVNLIQSLILGVHLTKCQMTQSLTKWQPDLKSDQMLTWSRPSSWEVHLNKCQPDSISQLTKWCQPDLTWGLNLQGVHLTKWQPDPKSDQMLSSPEASS